MWTHGYDVYTPQQSVVFHDYDAANKKKFDPREWINMGMVRYQTSKERDNALL